MNGLLLRLFRQDRCVSLPTVIIFPFMLAMRRPSDIAQTQHDLKEKTCASVINAILSYSFPSIYQYSMLKQKPSTTPSRWLGYPRTRSSSHV